jgi:hypothetical protein
MSHKPLPSGTKFHRLEVIEFVGRVKNQTLYRFRCECGTEKQADLNTVKAGKTKSCGCLLREHLKEVHKTFKPDFDLVGQTFGRLAVLSRAPRETRTEDVKWLCRCVCGNESNVRSVLLRSGKTQSCGCLRREILSAKNTRHGHTVGNSMTREYRIWLSMMNRCRNPNVDRYECYGGRGIKVCERWHAFDNFLADVGPIPAPLSIDRINNDGDYEPGNVRLATRKEQAANRRPRSKNHAQH